MIKYIFTLIIAVSFSLESMSQDYISLEVVDILNQNIEEATFYYEHNWEVLRKEAKKSAYIFNYSWYISNNNQKVFLITDFGTKGNWEKREEHFQQIIKNHKLQLLNNKKPSEFRRRSEITINKM